MAAISLSHTRYTTSPATINDIANNMYDYRAKDIFISKKKYDSHSLKATLLD